MESLVPTAAEILALGTAMSHESTLGQLGSGLPGQVLTGAGTSLSWKYPPGYEYAYTEFTSNVSVTATTEGTANTVVTASSIVLDGATSVLVEFSCPNWTIDSATRRLTFALLDGSTSLGSLYARISGGAANDDQGAVNVRRKLTPAAGAKTYSIRAYVSSGTGTVVAGVGGAGVAMPGFIRITKV